VHGARARRALFVRPCFQAELLDFGFVDGLASPQPLDLAV